VKIVDYMVVDNSNLSYFQAAIREAIADGWQPLGGVSVRTHYYQAMVKYETPPHELRKNKQRVGKDQESWYTEDMKGLGRIES